MNGNKKGSKFERDICKRLSEWWSDDTENQMRDDIFWRASQSGGRATQRAKSGKRTAGSYGDIAAVDPVGAPLLQVFTLELKRGRSHGDMGDMIDIPVSGYKPRPFEKTLEQAVGSHLLAKSLSWLLISQRDRRRCLVIGDYCFFRKHFQVSLPRVFLPHGWIITYLPLTIFLRNITPSEIIQLAENTKRKK
jgi:hypothetical protein